MIICGFGGPACSQPRSCRKVVVGQLLRGRVNNPIPGTQFFVRNKNAHRRPLLALLLLGPLVAGCSGGSMSDMFSSDLLSKDAEWFSRPGRLSSRNVSIETPPLTPNKPVTG